MLTRLPDKPDDQDAGLPLPTPATENTARYIQLCIDPDLDGDATLFAVCLQTFITQVNELGPAERRVYMRNWWWHVGRMAKPDKPAWQVRHWVKDVLTKDRPRYVPEGFGAPVILAQCEAPMQRRDGPCGKRPTVFVEDRDPLTGEGRWAHFCYRHRALAAPLQARRDEWFRNGMPEPAPNAGGVLNRYFKSDWTKLYQWACAQDPADGAKPPTMPPPMLKIVRGDAT